MKNLFKNTVISILTWESKAVLRKYQPKVIAITGTVGKTSTKDAIYTALSKSLSVRKTKKSQNSEIGIPLTILGCANPASNIFGWFDVMLEGLKLILMPSHYPEWLVLEVGADHPGDIKNVTKWIKPDVAVVTKLSKVPVHVEFFSSVEQVVEEKSYLVRALKPDGIAVLNSDDEDVIKFSELTKGKVLFFGTGDKADVSAENYEVFYSEDGAPEGIKFDIYDKVRDERFPVPLKGTLGEHLVYPVLAALTVAEAIGEEVTVAAKSLRSHEATPGRMRIIEGVEGSTVIDDSYNSSPVALEEALRTLSTLNNGRRIAVLGDMLELGKYSIDEHKKAGKLAEQHADILVTVGPRSQFVAESARQSGMTHVYEFDDSRKAGKFLRDFVQLGDVVLVKASQGIRAERVVEALMSHPEDKEKLLVRQDEEWKQRG
jgi:UDP-N-acetylmuramoyl-tripeptide--D-alanyl-D-alanine ligase